MKKSITGLLMCILLVGSLFAYDYVTNWSSSITIGSGNTVLVSAVSGRKIVIRDIIISVKNACSFYCFNAVSDDQVSPTFHFAANDGYDSRMARSPLNWVFAEGEGASINCSADPETKIQIIYDVID